jgi:hypothetical protein
LEGTLETAGDFLVYEPDLSLLYAPVGFMYEGTGLLPLFINGRDPDEFLDAFRLYGLGLLSLDPEPYARPLLPLLPAGYLDPNPEPPAPR